VRVIRGWKCGDVAALHSEIGAALQFPSYYGENWDACDECITDLEWAPGAWSLLHVPSIEAVVPGNARDFRLFVSVLAYAGRAWAEPRLFRSPLMGNPDVYKHPFNVIVSGSEAGRARSEAVLQEINAQEQVLSLEQATLSLAKQFVARQGIVIGAIRSLRPHFLLADRPDATEVRQAFEFSKIVPQLGTWGEDGEWQYFIHGRGCRLTHTVTGERLEWDAPDDKMFDRHWFMNWLEWRLAQTSVDPALLFLRERLVGITDQRQGLIFAALDELARAGLLSHPVHVNWNKYALKPPHIERR
jgi:hypothetical protein